MAMGSRRSNESIDRRIYAHLFASYLNISFTEIFDGVAADVTMSLTQEREISGWKNVRSPT
jgi:hypothetical protein